MKTFFLIGKIVMTANLLMCLGFVAFNLYTADWAWAALFAFHAIAATLILHRTNTIYKIEKEYHENGKR